MYVCYITKCVEENASLFCDEILVIFKVGLKLGTQYVDKLIVG